MSCMAFVLDQSRLLTERFWVRFLRPSNFFRNFFRNCLVSSHSERIWSRNIPSYAAFTMSFNINVLKSKKVLQRSLQCIQVRANLEKLWQCHKWISQTDTLIAQSGQANWINHPSYESIKATGSLHYVCQSCYDIQKQMYFLAAVFFASLLSVQYSDRRSLCEDVKNDGPIPKSIFTVS